MNTNITQCRKIMNNEVGKKYLILLGSAPLREVARKRQELREIEIRARKQVGRIMK